MGGSNTQEANKPKNITNNRQKHQPNKQFIRKAPPRAPQNSNRQNIYINTKTDFKAQLKRCEELFNSGIKEIYLHCLGYAITIGINLALQLIVRSCGVLDYAINTSTVHLIDELHPLCDADDISLRPRNNSALHIKVFSKNILNTTATQQQRLPKRSTTGSTSRRDPTQPNQGSSFRPPSNVNPGQSASESVVLPLQQQQQSKPTASSSSDQQRTPLQQHQQQLHQQQKRRQNRSQQNLTEKKRQN